MSDLLARIRSRMNDAPIPTERLLDEAADEIERLQRALEHIVNTCCGQPKTVTRAFALEAWKESQNG